MKTKVVLFVAAVLISGIASVFAAGQVKTEKFKVHGNCGMCESRIEKAARSVKGVSSADWEKNSMLMTVTFDQSKTEVQKIHAAIAKAGHDTETDRASDEVYEKLHSCCKYKRAEKQAGSHNHGAAMPGCTNDAQPAGCCG